MSQPFVQRCARARMLSCWEKCGTIETINIAMTAAETGHLLFSTLHTIGAANTIDRIIDVFPANQQHQIAVQLSLVLTAVISQQLVPGVDGRMLPAFEIMTVTPRPSAI